MIDQRRVSGRREDDAVISIAVPADLSADSPEVRQALAELNSGNKVVLSPPDISESGAQKHKFAGGAHVPVRVSSKGGEAFGRNATLSGYGDAAFQTSDRKPKHAGLNGTDLVTALSGGAALGIVTLAFAPASVIAAAAAAVIGVGLAGAARRFDRDEVDTVMDE